MILSSARLRSDIKEKLRTTFSDADFRFYHNMKEAEVELNQAEIIITYGEDLTDELVKKATRLKWVMVISAGLDKMPFEALKKKNILVTNARGIHKTPMAEYTISMMLQVYRQNAVLLEHQKQHIWDRKVGMTEISGKTIGILGTGAIGSEVARLAKAFNMTTIGFNSSGKSVTNFDKTVNIEGIKHLFEESDFILNVLPATPSTDGLLDRESFTTMKKSAVLINIGRGTTIVEKDLIEALKNNEIAHAVLDVFEKEPLSEESPLWDMKNVTVTPHLSGISPEYQDRAIDIFINNYKRYKANELSDMMNIIPYDRGY